MTAKNSTFAGQLKHFAQSVDIVDGKTFDQVRDLVCKYVTNELKGEYFELLAEETTGVDGEKQAWLRTFWSSEEKRHAWPMHPVDGAVRNPITDAVAGERPLWLVSPDRDLLAETESPLDLWSGVRGVGHYRPSSGEPIRTAIVVPLTYQNSNGAYCIESAQYFEATPVAKSELRRLGDALAILHELWQVNAAQSSCTDHAISDLRDLLENARFPKLALPHMFVASPKKADETVMQIVKEVLAEFKEKLEFTDWEQMWESGNISTQIAQEIVGSRFGICYFSEPVEGPDGRPSTNQYRDNPNVIFEAGMLHARTSATSDMVLTGEPAGWIPVREERSPEAPFDFASERILYVPRSTDGRLNETRLRQLLRGRIEALLRES